MSPMTTLYYAPFGEPYQVGEWYDTAGYDRPWPISIGYSSSRPTQEEVDAMVGACKLQDRVRRTRKVLRAESARHEFAVRDTINERRRFAVVKTPCVRMRKRGRSRP